jgi:hypothetical protein
MAGRHPEKPYIRRTSQSLMQCGEGTLCCGAQFEFDFEKADPGSVNFYAFEGTNVIMVVYTKNGKLYFDISFDCGKTFQGPKNMLDLRGEVNDIQILASEDKFVVALKESAKGQVSKRAISGIINHKDQTYISKECTDFQPKGREITNIALGIRKWEGHPGECETVDYVFIKDGNTMSLECQGHGSCKII